MELSDYKFIRLKSDTIILPFDCNDTDLNGFLFDDAINYTNQLLAVTYLIHDGVKTIGYFNYINDKISHRDLDNNLEKFCSRIGVYMPIDKSKHKSYPAVKIGRLAIHKENQNKGLGKIILDYTKNSFTDKNKTGCKFITVDAYKDSVNFYKKNGFKFLSNKDKKSDTRLMYFNLEALG
ncbi:GNAT family N-acetyltransferase [Mariniflexile sp. HNIBRBA6329]|uniref:GNAT family N-acetyltransferase n=1 Tax=Mariniflexile sp. HNIBRBA6329 TaxID=3373088 RepID=UPI0037488CCF